MRGQRGSAESISVADCAQLPHLLASNLRLNAHLGTNGRAVGNRPDQLYLEPLVAVGVVPIEEIVLSVVGHEEVEESIVVVIAPPALVGISSIVDEAAGRDARESAITVVAIKKVVQTVPAEEKVNEAVVVEVTPLR